MKENRYFQMVYLLLEKGNMTAPELARHFEVSVRTIYRDIDILSSAGIPVYAAQGKGGGIFLQDNFVLNKSILSEQEQRQILMALQSSRMMEDEATKDLLLKLGGVFQKQNTDWIEIDFSTWTKTGACNDTFRLLKSAIFKNKRVSFQYYSGKGEALMRSIEPLKLVFKTSDWYVYGYCTMREDYRFFKLTRMRNLEIGKECFIREVPDHIFTRSDGFEMDTIQVKLLFDKSTAHQVYDKFDDEITVLEDGSFLVETLLPDNELLYRFILSCGNKVEVLSPQRVREETARRIKNMAEIYRT